MRFKCNFPRPISHKSKQACFECNIPRSLSHNPKQARFKYNIPRFRIGGEIRLGGGMTCNQEKRASPLNAEKSIVLCFLCWIKGKQNNEKSYLLGKNLSCFRGDKKHPSGASVEEYFIP